MVNSLICHLHNHQNWTNYPKLQLPKELQKLSSNTIQVAQNILDTDNIGMPNEDQHIFCTPYALHLQLYKLHSSFCNSQTPQKFTVIDFCKFLNIYISGCLHTRLAGQSNYVPHLPIAELLLLTNTAVRHWVLQSTASISMTKWYTSLLYENSSVDNYFVRILHQNAPHNCIY